MQAFLPKLNSLSAMLLIFGISFFVLSLVITTIEFWRLLMPVPPGDWARFYGWNGELWQSIFQWMGCWPFGEPCTLPVDGPWYWRYETPPPWLVSSKYSIGLFVIAVTAALVWLILRNTLWYAYHWMIGGHVAVIGTTAATHQFSKTFRTRSGGRRGVIMAVDEPTDDYWELAVNGRAPDLFSRWQNGLIKFALQTEGITTLEQKTGPEALLDRVLINSAREIVIGAPDGGDTRLLVERVVERYKRPKSNPRHSPVKITGIVENPRLYEVLSKDLSAMETSPHTEVDLVSSAQLAARSLFREHPFDRLTYVGEDNHQGQNSLHLLFVGYNATASEIAMSALRTAHYQDGRKLHLTILDPGANTAVAILSDLTAQFIDKPTLVSIECDFNNTTLVERFLADIIGGSVAVNAIYICDDTPAERLHRLQLVERTVHENDFICPPIYTKPMSKKTKAARRKGFTRFGSAHGMTSEFGHPATIFQDNLGYRDTLDKIAKEAHRSYLNERRTDGTLSTDQPAHRPWAELPEYLKQSNRFLADHFWIKLRDLRLHAGIDISSNFSIDAASTPSDLAAAEHRRWNADKFLDGWQYADDRDDEKKRHDNLVPFEKLSSDLQQYDKQAISDVIKFATDVGYGIASDLRIALLVDDSVTTSGAKKIARTIIEKCKEIEKRDKNQRFVMIASTFASKAALSVFHELSKAGMHPLPIVTQPSFQTLEQLGDLKLQQQYATLLEVADTIVATRNAMDDNLNWWAWPGLLSQEDILVHAGPSPFSDRQTRNANPVVDLTPQGKPHG